MIWKYLEQNALFPKDLNWVQHRVSRIGLSFFKANVIAAKAIISGENLSLLPALRVDKVRRLLFDRHVSQVHSFLKSVHDPKIMVGHFPLTDNFSIVSVFPLRLSS